MGGADKSTIYLVGAPAGEQQNILAIARKDVSIIPDLGANGIKAVKAVSSELIGPIGLPLLVDVVRSSLRRDGRAEQDDRGHAAERFNEPRTRRGGQVLGDLQADGQIAGAGWRRPRFQVHLREFYSAVEVGL